mgnify:CR=1 FL=1
MNVAGCFVMGVFFAQFGPRNHPLLMTGILGGFTTFSAFSLDALKLWEGGATAQAALYVGLSVALSLVAVALGAAEHEALDRDAAGNASRGDVELVDCRNVLVDSDGPHVSVIGLEDVVVVVDGGEVLVTTRAGAQLVGKLAGASNQ